MDSFEQTLDIPSYLCDRKDLLHPWAAVRLCQEVSEFHSKATGIGYEDMLKQNRIWIISRAYYIIYKRPAAFEKVMLSTWSRGNDGLFAFRDYRMVDAKGETLLAGTTYWPMIDFASRRPIRLKEALAGYEYRQEEATNHSVLDRLRLPDMSECDGRFELQAQFSLIDHAQHVNNSEYVKFAIDSIMQTGFDIDRPFSIEMNYQHETQPNDTLSVLRKQMDDATFVQISNSRGLSVIAKIVQN
ncbi:MAG: hypothetical protein IJ634_06210 [Bacteroidales bacterium]|nr:hypothetical protein [Bacteroidales bacterium]